MPKPRLLKPTSKRAVAQRWTEDLIEDGWTPISNFFLDHYHRLIPEITTLEALFIIHLMQHKWSADAPFPSMKTIARKMRKGESSVRGYARSLEQKRYLVRENRVATSNRYHLDQFLTKLEALREQVLAEEAARERAMSRRA